MKNDPNAVPNYRIKGGSSQLINKLAQQLSEEQIELNQVVKSITYQKEGVFIETASQVYHAHFVISTLPPALLAKGISFSPTLPINFQQIAPTTHTWMGESIKMGLRYATPFWRKERSSGTILGNNGIVNECYDHSDMEAGHYALKGFIHPTLHTRSTTERRDAVLAQFQKYYGEQVNGYLSYEEYVWQQDSLTYTAYPEQVEGHQYNGEALFREAYFDGRLLISGSETAQDYPGYMDGAVSSAHRVVKQVLENKLLHEKVLTK